MSEEDDTDQSSVLALADAQPKNFIVRNHYYLYDDINDDTSKQLIVSLHSMALSIISQSLDSGALPCPIELHINSTGGGLMDTLAIIQHMENIQKGVSTAIGGVHVPIAINTHIEGEADSGASLISICGSKRYCSKYALSLIHDSRSINVTYMKVKDKEVDIQNDKTMNNIYRGIYLSHTKLTDKELDEIFKIEKYYTPEELLKWGCIDEIE